MKPRITRRALRDLDDIWRFIARDNDAAADRVEENFYAAIRMPADHPGFGHRREDAQRPRYRFWSVHPYVIAYRVQKEELVVVRVVHGGRDFQRLFSRSR